MRRDRTTTREQPGPACGPWSRGLSQAKIRDRAPVPIDREAVEEQSFGSQQNPSKEYRLGRETWSEGT